MPRTLALTAVCLCLAVAIAEAGPEWEEPLDTDAGSLPDSAIAIQSMGEVLARIQGILEGPSALHANGAPDFQDMFLIRICDPAEFTAVVDPIYTTFDTELWLFSVDELGLLANDDDATQPPFSAIRMSTADDGTESTIPSGGSYYLAISGHDSNPVSTSGEIFRQTTFELSGPDGLGGDLPISGWSADGAFGRYAIALTGVVFFGCPADLDCDQIVGFTDLLLVLAAWGPCDGCPEDLDKSGDVGFTDLITVLSEWGFCLPV